MKAKDHQPLPHPSQRRAPRLLDDDLVRAAEILEGEAEALLRSHTVHGEWDLATEIDRRAKADYDEYRAIAKRFRRVAGKL